MTELRHVVLERIETGDTGTFGKVTTDSGFQCYSIELPWRGNARGKSCIVPGPVEREVQYLCEVKDSPKHGPCYYVLNVAGRTDVEIHSANWAGDLDKGLRSQLLGCIALGRAIGDIAGQKGVMSSKDAIAGFMADLESKPFVLTIRWSLDANDAKA